MRHGFHQPVLGKEVVECLLTDPCGVYVDCTLGGGGHCELLLQNMNSEGWLIGLDADVEAIQFSAKRLQGFPNTYFRQIFYDQLSVALYEVGRYPVHGVLYDLGVSSRQIDVDRRGFSYQQDGPLDMRMDQRQALTAAEVLNTYSKDALGTIFKLYGEERHWRAIAQEIVRRRSTQSLKNTRELVSIIRSIVGERFLTKSLSRIFQAVRIEVNRELDRLKDSLQQAYDLLGKDGRIAVISYHSLEDRIVKTFFRDKETECICPLEFPICTCDKVQEMKRINRRPILPTASEIDGNSRARSAKLRVAQKTVDIQA